MKTIYCFFAAFLVAITTVNAQPNFKISGNVKGLQDNTKLLLVVYNSPNGTKTRDSAIVKNGKFEFTGKVNRPVFAYISTFFKEDADYHIKTLADKQSFYLTPGRMSITGNSDLRSATITGGITQKEFASMQAKKKPYEDEMFSIQKKLFANKYKEEEKQKMYDKLAALRQHMNKIEEHFRIQHPDSYISLDMVKMMGGGVINLKTFEPAFYALSDRMRNTPEGKTLESRLMLAKKLSIGQTAMDFTQNDVEGNPVSLSSYRGKYVLLDFWASWCGPCRAENPNVLKAYNKYKDKNFDVLAVSLDENRKAWIKAIKDDGMPWVQVSDLKGWKSQVATQYGIKAIPQNFLIDPNGIIIAKNLRGEELLKKLAELFND